MRRLLAALALLPLVACGFHPLYAERSPLGYDPALAAIDVRPAPDRIGQIIAQTLREQLNPRGAHLPARYILTLEPRRGALRISASSATTPACAASCASMSG